MDGLRIMATASFLEILQAGLITMMTVSDENRFRSHQTSQLSDHTLIRNGPKSVNHFQMIGGLERGGFFDRPIENGGCFITFIWVKSEHRAKVHPGGPE